MECCTPLGLPVEPEVYSRKSGCSASTHSGSQVLAWPASTSLIQRSRPAVMVMSAPVRLTTSTFLTLSQPPKVRASSTMALSGRCLPPRTCWSAVITATAPVSSIRSRSDCAEKPPNTTEWVAPMRAQACMAATPSTDMEM